MNSSAWALPTVVFAAFVCAGSAVAQASYLPLSEGNTWAYTGVNGTDETRLVTGQIELFGHEVWTIRHPVSQYNPQLENYWTTTDEGDVLLWGFWRGWGRAYNPPLTAIASPLELGKTWSSTVDVYDLPDFEFLGVMTLEFTVHEDGLVVVPAGVYPAFGVGYSESPLLVKDGVQHAPYGSLATVEMRNISEWWSPGIGLVQYQTMDLYQLVSYQIAPVGAQSQTFSGVKQLFR